MLTQDELELRNFLLVHFADDDGGIDRRQHRAHVMGEFDRAGTIEKGVELPMKFVVATVSSTLMR